MDKTMIIIILVCVCCISSSIGGGVGIYFGTKPKPTTTTKKPTTTPAPTSASAAGTPAPTSAPTSAPAAGTSASAAGTPAPVPKLKNPTDANTGLNEGSGQVQYLDRHILDCGDQKVINQFNLHREGNNFRYNYKCSTGGAPFTGILSKNTPDNENNRGYVQYLDRHDVKCDDDSFLSYFRLVTGANSTMRYDYRCSKTDKPLTCRSLSTPQNERGDTYYLDRHNIKCEDDEALQRFKLETPDGKIAYNYTCCKFK